MNDQHAPDGEQDRFEIVFEVPPSPQGAYQYERDDGTIVHGDAGGEWTLDEDGEIDDIVFFVSPSWTRRVVDRAEDTSPSPNDDARQRKLAGACSENVLCRGR